MYDKGIKPASTEQKEGLPTNLKSKLASNVIITEWYYDIIIAYDIAYISNQMAEVHFNRTLNRLKQNGRFSEY